MSRALRRSDHVEQADAAAWRPDRTYDPVTVHFLHTPDRAVRDAFFRAAWRAAAGRLLIVAHDPANLAEGTPGGPPNPAFLHSANDVLEGLGLASANPSVTVAETRRRQTSHGLWLDAVVVLQRRAPLVRVPSGRGVAERLRTAGSLAWSVPWAGLVP